MCVALICPPKVRPSLPLLQACHRANPHGAGIAWREKGRIHWRKGLGPCEVHQLASEHSGEVIIHFRWASVGVISPRLCHPFPVTSAAELAAAGTAAAVLFHNGTWGEWERALPTIGQLEGPVSDSRAAAALVSHSGSRFLRRLPGRWAVMRRREVELHGEWLQYQGLLVSNRNFERHLPTPPAARGPSRPSSRQQTLDFLPV